MSCRPNYDPCLDSKLNQIGSYAAAARSSAQNAAASAEQSEDFSQASAFSAGQSATSATNAANSASEANNYLTQVTNIFNDFDERYLGAKNAPPATDNQGNPLQEGALYWNSVSDTMYVWDGASWITATGFNETTPFLATGTTTNRDLQDRFADVVNVKDFGAVGDGIADDTDSIQDAIDSLSTTGGVIYFPYGEYLIRRIVGTNDRWGIKVTNSNVTLLGYEATLRRYNPNISTYALAYPIILVGTPDSNVATATENVTIIGIKFVGENTQHSSSGAAPHDGRYAIEAKNTKNLTIQNNVFTNIDSSAIWFQKPVEYDWANNVYYNTTKNYNATISECKFTAKTHAVAGRALIHAVVNTGADGCVVTNNKFEWTDGAISTSTTYDIGKIASDTYIPNVAGWSLGAVQRAGRATIFSNNYCINCSEHAVYMEGADEVVSGNSVVTDEFALCNTTPIKITGFNGIISGNICNGYGSGIAVQAPAKNVSVTGNIVKINTNVSTFGGIGVSSVGLYTYLNDRSAYLNLGRIMTGISVVGNSVEFLPNAAVDNNRENGIFVWSNETDTGYNRANGGQLSGVTISGNTITNHNIGIRVQGLLHTGISITGNTFIAKPFTGSGFSTSTTMNTWATVCTVTTQTDSLQYISFKDNTVYGCKYLVATTSGSGTSLSIEAPYGMSGNRLDYIQYLYTSDIKTFSFVNGFLNNTGLYEMDRTFNINGNAHNNSLSNGVTNSQKRGCFEFTGTNLLYYTNDSNSFLTLA